MWYLKRTVNKTSRKAEWNWPEIYNLDLNVHSLPVFLLMYNYKQLFNYIHILTPWHIYDSIKKNTLCSLKKSLRRMKHVTWDFFHSVIDSLSIIFSHDYISILNHLVIQLPTISPIYTVYLSYLPMTIYLSWTIC